MLLVYSTHSGQKQNKKKQTTATTKQQQQQQNNNQLEIYINVSRHFLEYKITLIARYPGDVFKNRCHCLFTTFTQVPAEHAAKVDKMDTLTQDHRKNQIGRNLRCPVQPPPQSRGRSESRPGCLLLYPVKS